jgi:hypothetical protein
MRFLKAVAFSRRPLAAFAGAAAAFAFAPSASASVPLVPGDAFHYAFTNDSTVDEPGYSPGHYSSKGTFSVAVSGGVSFAGRANLMKLHYSSPNSPAAEDDYVGFDPLAGGRFEQRLFGAVSTFGPKIGNGISTRTLPAGSIQNVYPEAKGPAWSPAADSTTLTQPYGPASPSSFKETAFADGSYRWTEDISLYVGGIVQGAGSLASDGSAKMTSRNAGFNAGTITFEKPLARKTGFAIPVTSEGFNQLPAPPLKAATRDVPDWFPGNALAPRPLLIDTETNNGRAITPRACGRRAGLAAFDLHESTRSLDPLVGSLVVTTTDEFDVAVFGNVCTISKTSFAAYDNRITGRLLENVTSTSVTILNGVSGPRPSAEPFSLDLTPAGTLFIVTYVPISIGVTGPQGSGARR